ncbi:MAG: hypothetical protein ACRDWT_08900, partial [Jatrophihabitantaceae bacterium]
MTSIVRNRVTALSVAALAAVTLLAACSSSGNSDSNGTGTSTQPAAAGASDGASAGANVGVAYAKAELAKFEGTRDTYGTPVPVADVPSLKGKTIWYVPIGTGVPVLASIGTAMTDALGKLGAKVHVCDGKFQPTTVASCMSTAVTQDASAVVTGFVDYAAAPSAFQSIVAQGIPVLVGGEAPSAGVTAS